MDKEKKQRCAGIIAKDPDMLQFMYEMFCPEKTKVRAETEKNVLALSDEDYGKAMKLLFLTETHFLSVMAEIKQIAGTPASGKNVPLAPK
jgi:hypothetical protein